MVFGLLLLGLIQARTCSFLDKAEEFHGLHICDLCYASLHDEKMWVVDIEFDRTKEIPNLLHGFLL